MLHHAGINTFLKAPYLEYVTQVGNYDIEIVGVPHDSCTIYRPDTRFGSQGIRQILGRDYSIGFPTVV